AADHVQPADGGVTVDADQAPSQLLDQLAAQLVAVPHLFPHDAGPRRDRQPDQRRRPGVLADDRHRQHHPHGRHRHAEPGTQQIARGDPDHHQQRAGNAAHRVRRDHQERQRDRQLAQHRNQRRHKLALRCVQPACQFRQRYPGALIVCSASSRVSCRGSTSLIPTSVSTRAEGPPAGATTATDPPDSAARRRALTTTPTTVESMNVAPARSNTIEEEWAQALSHAASIAGPVERSCSPRSAITEAPSTCSTDTASGSAKGSSSIAEMKTMLEATASPAQGSPILPPRATARGSGARRRRQLPASLSHVFAASYSSGSNTRYSPGEIQPKALIAWRIQSLSVTSAIRPQLE